MSERKIHRLIPSNSNSSSEVSLWQVQQTTFPAAVSSKVQFWRLKTRIGSKLVFSKKVLKSCGDLWQRRNWYKKGERSVTMHTRGHFVKPMPFLWENVCSVSSLPS